MICRQLANAPENADLQGFPLQIVMQSLSIRVMRIVIQQTGSRRYFTGSAWDENESKAAQFENVAEAEACCRARKIGTALIVLKFKDEEVCYEVGEHEAHLCPKLPLSGQQAAC